MTSAAPERIRMSELLGVLSLGADLGMGQPMEHVLRQCLIALHLAERLGLDESSRLVVYYTSMLAWVGCHVDAYEQAKWFGDDPALKAGFRRVDFSGPTAAAEAPVLPPGAGERFSGYGCRQRSKMGPMRRSKTRPLVRRFLVCRVLGFDAGQGVDAAVA